MLKRNPGFGIIILVMKKVALILHGWPQTEMNQHFLVKFMKSRGYLVNVPNLYEIEKSWDINQVTDFIIAKLKGATPDLIVGISLGGLILPHIAVRYPNSKLVFIASGVKFNPKFILTKFGITLLKIQLVRKMFVKIGNKIPTAILEFIYRAFNPFKGKLEDKKLYGDDLRCNINAIKDHSFEKHLILLDLITRLDNKSVLSNLRNKALIFTGENDILMPKSCGEEIQKYLSNCELVIKNGSHFNIFGEEDLQKLNEFLHM